jgi:hypothetical protein
MRSNDPALNPAERARLAAILGLLSSDKPGERDAAAHAATRFIQVRNLQWPDIITSVLPTPGVDPDIDPIGVDWRRTAAACSRYPLLLNKWEAEFIAGLPRFPRLTAKQRECLLKIVVRLRACGCEL